MSDLSPWFGFHSRVFFPDSVWLLLFALACFPLYGLVCDQWFGLLFIVWSRLYGLVSRLWFGLHSKVWIPCQDLVHLWSENTGLVQGGRISYGLVSARFLLCFFYSLVEYLAQALEIPELGPEPLREYRKPCPLNFSPYSSYMKSF